MSIPFSLARRFRCIGLGESNLEVRIQNHKRVLQLQKYPDALIDAGISKAKALDRSIAWQVWRHHTVREYFNPRNTGFYGAIRHDLTILQRHNHMKDFFQTLYIYKAAMKASEKSEIRAFIPTQAILQPLFATLDMYNFKDGSVHFRNSGMKGLNMQ